MREAEPKDYDITDPKNYNLHKSTYCNGVGHIARGNVSGFVSSFSDFIQFEFKGYTFFSQFSLLKRLFFTGKTSNK